MKASTRACGPELGSLMMGDVALLANHTSMTQRRLESRGQLHTKSSCNSFEVHMTHTPMITSQQIRYIAFGIRFRQKHCSSTISTTKLVINVTLDEPAECRRGVITSKGHARERILHLKEHLRRGANNFTSCIVKAIPLFKLEQQASCVTYNGASGGAFRDSAPFSHEGRLTDKSSWKFGRNMNTSEGDRARPRSRLEQKTAPATTNERRSTNTSNSHRTRSYVKAKGFIHSGVNCSTTVNNHRARSQNRENLLC